MSEDNAPRTGTGTGTFTFTWTAAVLLLLLSEPVRADGTGLNAIGSAAMLSRALAGVTREGLIVFAMPGSPAAVRLACDRLILPELGHVLREVRR